MAAQRRRRRRRRARTHPRPTNAQHPPQPTARATGRRRPALVAILVAFIGTACLGARALQLTTVEAQPGPPAAAVPAPAVSDTAVSDTAAPELSYAGRDARNRPRYVQRPFDDDERRLLREAFGVSDPNRLWLPDSSPGAVLRYDGTDGIAARVGYRSWRRRGETWEEFGRRIRRLPRREWPTAARHSYHAGLASLDADARRAFADLVDSARAAGFRVRVAESYRAPERQAYILAHGNGQTFTATSPHVYGRAADILVGDGRINTTRKVREWIRFRRWVLAFGEGRFRLVGDAARTWDWPHVELADAPIGFRTVEEVLAAARRCLAVPAASEGEDPCALPRDPAGRAEVIAAARAEARAGTRAAGRPVEASGR